MNSIDNLKDLDLDGLKTALVASREEQFRLRSKNCLLYTSPSPRD